MSGLSSNLPGVNCDFKGLVRGIVAMNDDPKKIGRVRIRIYNIHGTAEEGIPDDALPWAFGSQPYAAYNSGSFIVPEVGSTVWVVFEDVCG